MSNIQTDNIQNRDGSLSVPTSYVVRGSAKAWADIIGTGTIALRDSLNVASVTDNGTGDYTFNYTANFDTAFYSTTACALGTSAGAIVTASFLTGGVGSANLIVDVTTPASSTSSRIDRVCWIAAHGDLA